MIVHDLDIVRVSARPTEAEPPLVIDPDAVLTCAISQQFFEPIRRWHHQISKRGCCIQNPEFPKSGALQIGREPRDPLALEQLFRVLAPEAADHSDNSNAPRYHRQDRKMDEPSRLAQGSDILGTGTFDITSGLKAAPSPPQGAC